MQLANDGRIVDPRRFQAAVVWRFFGSLKVVDPEWPIRQANISLLIQNNTLRTSG
jgi:hypothetical protein